MWCPTCVSAVSVIGLMTASSIAPSYAWSGFALSPSSRQRAEWRHPFLHESSNLICRNIRSVRPHLYAVSVDETDGLSNSMPLELDLPALPQLQRQQLSTSTTASNWWGAMDRDELISRAINGVFLAVSFGMAAYEILNINQGMTRGWTQSEIAMRIPLDTWSSYETALESSPIATKTMINVIIYLLGDWLSQTVFAKQHVLDFDLGRTLRNGFIGLCFGPVVHEYYQFSDAILPVEGGIENRIMKIFMDQTIYLSVKCSVYIMAVNILQGESLETATNAVKERIRGVVFTAWKFWPLVHCITYSVVPARHRILWVNCVDLVWNAILASMSQKTKPEEETENQFALAQECDVVITNAPMFSSNNFEAEDLIFSNNTTTAAFDPILTEMSRYANSTQTAN